MSAPAPASAAAAAAPARKVKFVASDPTRGGLPVKRKQVQQACASCRRKKVRPSCRPCALPMADRVAEALHPRRGRRRR